MREGESFSYSLALAYELISQLRQTSSKAGAVHSIIPPVVQLDRECPKNTQTHPCRQSSRKNKPAKPLYHFRISVVCNFLHTPASTTCVPISGRFCRNWGLHLHISPGFPHGNQFRYFCPLRDLFTFICTAKEARTKKCLATPCTAALFGTSLLSLCSPPLSVCSVKSSASTASPTASPAEVRPWWVFRAFSADLFGISRLRISLPITSSTISFAICCAPFPTRSRSVMTNIRACLRSYSVASFASQMRHIRPPGSAPFQATKSKFIPRNSISSPPSAPLRNARSISPEPLEPPSPSVPETKSSAAPAPDAPLPISACAFRPTPASPPKPSAP